MNNDKPARLITKLTETTRTQATEIASLRAQLDTQNSISKRRETRWTTQNKVNDDLLEANAALTKQAADLHASIKAIDEQNLANLAAHDRAQAELTAFQNQMEAERVVARENAEIIDRLQPQLDAIEQARDDLSKVLDGVRDRMKRKELEAERAILNRKVLADARPDMNRR